MMWWILAVTAWAGSFDLIGKDKQGARKTPEPEPVEVPEAPAAPVAVEVPAGWPPMQLQAPPEAQRSESGLAWLVVQAGPEGPTPAAADSRVTVHYTGWQAVDGLQIDSSLERDTPASFRLDQVIPGWTEGLQHLRVGDKARFWIPGALAYGNEQVAPGRPFGPLVFDIELLAFEDVQRRPVPEDVAAPPVDAQTSESGLAWRVLELGGGGPKPERSSKVTVHYAGWLTDGTEFDSSFTRGTPATFPLNRVIEGWTEGLQLMSVGDTYRLWIPVELAYKDAPGKPPGMLVFDVQLLAIEP